MLKCPKCGSSQLYHEISVYAKLNINTGKVFDVNKSNEDNFFDTVYCNKCEWNTDKEQDEIIKEKYESYKINR